MFFRERERVERSKPMNGSDGDINKWASGWSWSEGGVWPLLLNIGSLYAQAINGAYKLLKHIGSCDAAAMMLIQHIGSYAALAFGACFYAALMTSLVLPISSLTLSLSYLWYLPLLSEHLYACNSDQSYNLVSSEIRERWGSAFCWFICIGLKSAFNLIQIQIQAHKIQKSLQFICTRPLHNESACHPPGQR